MELTLYRLRRTISVDGGVADLAISEGVGTGKLLVQMLANQRTPREHVGLNGSVTLPSGEIDREGAIALRDALTAWLDGVPEYEARADQHVETVGGGFVGARQ